MMPTNAVCERCTKPLIPGIPPYTAYLDSNHEFDRICYECAQQCYEDGWDITEEGSFDSLAMCCSCREFFTEHELRVVDNGELECRDCIDGDLSHGGSATIHYGDVDIEELRKKDSYVKATPSEIAEIFCGELNFGYVGWDGKTGELDIYHNREAAIRETTEFIKSKFGGNR